MKIPVSPAPPLASEELPHVGAGLRFLEAPTDYLAELRARYGDTFFVDLFGFPLLFTFSPRGLESLYQLPEDVASFGLATYDMIGFKTPTEIFADVDIALFRELLVQARMPGYLALIDEVVQREFAGRKPRDHESRAVRESRPGHRRPQSVAEVGRREPSSTTGSSWSGPRLVGLW